MLQLLKQLFLNELTRYEAQVIFLPSQARVFFFHPFYFHSINVWLVSLWHLWPRVGQIQGIGGLSRAAIQIA